VAFVSSLVFSWVLSHYHISSNKNAKICALLGLIYGIGFIVFTYVSFDYLDVRLPDTSLNIGVIVFALYILAVPGLVAGYFANKTRFSKIKKIQIGPNGTIAIIVLIGLFIIGSRAISAYDGYAKRGEVAGALAKVGIIKADYSAKLANGEISSLDTIGLTALDLFDYGLDEIQHINVERTENTRAFKYERQIELTPRQIIITFGPGFDGLSEKTLIVEIEELSKDSERWSCKGGTLSDKYRPSICRNDNN